MYKYGSLLEWIEKGRKNRSQTVLYNFVNDIAQGISHMHQHGFVHADIKPQNILIDFDEESKKLFCVLTDFGITQVFNNRSLLVEAFVPVQINAGSIRYASPEGIMKFHKQANIAPADLPKMDVYAYGIVMYEMIFRKRVYK